MAGTSDWDVELANRWGGGAVRYPDPAVQVLDPRFARFRIGNAAVELLYTEARWLEGPVWFGDGRFLIFSDIPNDRMLCYSEVTGQVNLFRHPSFHSNGNTRDRQGRLVTCEHYSRRVTRTEHDGSLIVLMDGFEGKPLNAPNDVVVHSDGSVWFTDPGYGILVDYEGSRAEPELPNQVYRLDPITGAATVVADDFIKPNGLCFSPDETRLYISDTGISHDPNGPGHVRVFDVIDGRLLTGGDVFATMAPGFADGMRTDRDGNLWASVGWAGTGTDGVHCLAPNGDLIGHIHLPEPCSNLCFGGLKKNRLYMTAGQSLYALYVESRGAQTP